MRKLKKCIFYAVIFVLAVVAGAFAFEFSFKDTQEEAASAAEVYTYTVVNGGVRLDTLSGATGTLSIPETYQGQPVVELGNNFFVNNAANVQYITIPKTVIKIGDYIDCKTFNACVNLVSVTVDASNDYYLSDGGVLYSKTDGEPCTLMVYPRKKTGASYTVLPGTQYIAAIAAQYNINLVSVSMPASLLQVGNYAFYNCTSLTTVNIPANVNFIGDYAFATTAVTAAGLTISSSANINLSNTSFYQSAIYNGATNNSIYYDDNWALGLKGTYSGATATLNAGTLGFAGGIFTNNRTLTSISFPNSLRTIPSYAFAESINIAGSVTLPSSVKSIGRSVFQNTKITSCNMGDTSIQELPPEVFVNCTQLSSVILPPNLKSIDSTTFQNSGIMNGAAANSMVYVDSWIVGYKGSLSAAQNFNSAFGIAKGALASSNITSATLPSTLLYIGDYAFQNCTSLASVSIAAADVQIGQYAFGGCTALTSLTLTNVKRIGDYAFAGSMTTGDPNVSLPSSLLSIGNHAFYGCSQLKASDFTIPASVVEIGYYAFSNTKLYNDAANGILYKDNWALDYKGDRTAASLTFANGTKGLAACAVSRFTNLTSVAIPSSVVYIGTHAFYYCKELVSITFSGNLETVGDYAFFLCRNLDEIMFLRGENSQITQAGQGLLYSAFNADVFVLPDAETTYEGANNWNSIRTRINPLAEIHVDTGTAGGSVPSAVYYLFPGHAANISLNASVVDNYYFVGWQYDAGAYYANIPITTYTSVLQGGKHYLTTVCAAVAGNYTESFVYNGVGQGPLAAVADRQVVHAYTGTGYSAAAPPVNTGAYSYSAIIYYSGTWVGKKTAVAFNITPKLLSASFWTPSVYSSVTFNGSRHLPAPVVTDDALGVLTIDKDYTVSYGTNYSYTTGGSVQVTGIGNYQSVTSKSFAIEKAAQSGFFLSIRYGNEKVGLESIAPTLADYEIAFLPTLGYSGNYITVYAYTTAVYPDVFNAAPGTPNTSQTEAQELIFTVTSPGSSLKADSYSYDLVEIEGIRYSRTTAKIYLSNTSDTVQYGVNTLSVIPADSANYTPAGFSPIDKPIDDGYEEDFGEEDPTPLIQKLFIKRNHTAGGSFYSPTGDPIVIAKEYGASAFGLTAGLNSGKNDFTLVSGDSALLSITGAEPDSYRTAVILNAGTVTVTMRHPGFVTLSDLSNSYVAVVASLTVHIGKAPLTIAPADKRVIYGTAVTYDKASFNFSGFKNGDTSNIIASVSCNYNPATMKDTGTYYLTAYGAVFDTAVTTYQNYTISYPSNAGYLIIQKKLLESYIDDITKRYGEQNPAFPITYSGFIAGESEENALDFVAPSIDFGGVGALTNIGQYTVYLSGGSARNYTIAVTDTAKLTIIPVPISISLENKSADYSAKSCPSNTPLLSGVAGGTVPSGYYTVSYLYNGSYETFAPVDVGFYTVKVTYTHGDIDNYENTERVFADSIEILPIAPSFILTAVVRDYDTDTYGGIPSLGSVEKSVEGGSQPAGSVTYLYSYEGGEYTPALPVDSGAYSVRMIYTFEEGTIDNYRSGAYRDFENILTIEKVEVTIELSKAQAVYQSSDGITPDHLHANAAVPHGIGAEYTLNDVKYPYTLHYRYFVDGSWQEEAPYHAGSYRVEVSFQTHGGLNYKDTVEEFNNAVEILPADPTLSLQPKATSYTGKRIPQNAATAAGIAGGTLPEGTFEYLFAQHGSDIRYFAKDLSVINVNPDGGGYDILVRFIAAPSTNYNNIEQRFDSAIVIMPIAPTISMKASSVGFNGTPFDKTKIAASVVGIAGGSAPQGTLSYQFLVEDEWTSEAPVNAGDYSIRIIYTPPTVSVNGTHANYTAATGTFADMISIKKVNPKISVKSITSEYTGNPVTLSKENGDVTITGISELFPPQGSILIEYDLSGDVWSVEGPVDSGLYRVRISYIAIQNENYNSYVSTFYSAVNILKIAPQFVDLQTQTVIFSGNRAEVQYHLAVDGQPGNGTLSLSYKTNGVWTSRAPTYAGTYDVRIHYTATSVDNYRSHTKEYPGALVIEKRVVYVTPLEGQSKVYDGTPVTGISYEIEGLIEGDRLAGALTIGPYYNVGDGYTIMPGDLRIDTTGKPEGYENNYEIQFVSDVRYVIERAVLSLTFTELSPQTLVYRPNDNKDKYIDVRAAYGDESIDISYVILGDAVNVGKFTVEAKLPDGSSTNYALPEERSKDYTITKAVMDAADNVFEDINGVYNGTEQSIAMARYLEGSTVVYSYNGESSGDPFSWVTAGKYKVTATVTNPNYSDVVLTATLTIQKAVLNIKIYKPEVNLEYGDPLPALVCDQESGSLTFDEGQTLLPGTLNYSWTYVPGDPVNYQTLHGAIPLTVDKAQTSIAFSGELLQSVSDPSVPVASIYTETGVRLKDATVTVTYTARDGTLYSELPTEPGRYTLSVTFSGDEHYAAAVFTDELVIKGETDNKWIFVLLSIVGGIGLIAILAGVIKRRRV